MIIPGFIDLIVTEGDAFVFGMTRLSTRVVFCSLILLRWLGDIRRWWLAGIRRILLQRNDFLRLLIELITQLTQLLNNRGLSRLIDGNSLFTLHGTIDFDTGVPTDTHRDLYD